MTRSTCATCRFHGGEKVLFEGNLYSTCRPEPPRLSRDMGRLPNQERPAYIAEHGWTASDYWCGSHGMKDRTQEPTADRLEFGAPTDQPR